MRRESSFLAVLDVFTFENVAQFFRLNLYTSSNTRKICRFIHYKRQDPYNKCHILKEYNFKTLTVSFWSKANWLKVSEGLIFIKYAQ